MLGYILKIQQQKQKTKTTRIDTYICKQYLLIPFLILCPLARCLIVCYIIFSCLILIGRSSYLESKIPSNLLKCSDMYFLHSLENFLISFVFVIFKESSL